MADLAITMIKAQPDSIIKAQDFKTKDVLDQPLFPIDDQKEQPIIVITNTDSAENTEKADNNNSSNPLGGLLKLAGTVAGAILGPIGSIAGSLLGGILGGDSGNSSDGGGLLGGLAKNLLG